MFPIDADIDQSALAVLTTAISDAAAKTEELADGLENDARAAEDVA